MIGYKYRANLYSERDGFRDTNSLINDELFASPLQFLNDPFEATYIDSINEVLKQLERYFGAQTANVQKHWNAITQFREKIGVYSLALSDENYPDNELLWAHYANSHKGFCIEYDSIKLEDSEVYAFNVNKILIKYQDSPPSIGIEDILDKNKSSFLEKLFGTKSQTWSYEKEIRLLYDAFGVRKYNPFSLKSVYFGLNMDDSQQNTIIDGLTNRDVKFYKMEHQTNSYRLVSRLIHENTRYIEDKLNVCQYEILRTDHNHAVENFDVLYIGEDKSEEQLIKFTQKFREQYATKQANINIYDSKAITYLLGKYPLEGTERAFMAKHWIGMSIFDTPEFVFMYPDRQK